MQVAYEKSDNDLWAELTGCFYLVRRYASMFHYTFVEENGKTQGENARLKIQEIYNNLSPELKGFCVNEKTLIELANLSDNQLNFEKSRFLNTMPQIKQRAKTKAQTGNMAGLLQGLNIFLIEEKAEQ